MFKVVAANGWVLKNTWLVQNQPAQEFKTEKAARKAIERVAGRYISFDLMRTAKIIPV
jgi:hypothetical protein